MRISLASLLQDRCGLETKTWNYVRPGQQHSGIDAFSVILVMEDHVIVRVHLQQSEVGGPITPPDAAGNYLARVNLDPDQEVLMDDDEVEQLEEASFADQQLLGYAR